MKEVVDAAKAGSVPVRLVCSMHNPSLRSAILMPLFKPVSDLSDKNPLITLPATATLLDLLQVFSRGTHRVVLYSSLPELSSPAQSTRAQKPLQVVGLVSDRHALSWFITNAPKYSEPSLEPLLEASLSSLRIVTQDVVSKSSTASVLDAMQTMSEEGLSSLPIVDVASGRLLSVVSVNDIGKVRQVDIVREPLHLIR